jgi:hypothetical protein
MLGHSASQNWKPSRLNVPGQDTLMQDDGADFTDRVRYLKRRNTREDNNDCRGPLIGQEARSPGSFLPGIEAGALDSFLANGAASLTAFATPLGLSPQASAPQASASNESERNMWRKEAEKDVRADPKTDVTLSEPSKMGTDNGLRPVKLFGETEKPLSSSLQSAVAGEAENETNTATSGMVDSKVAEDAFRVESQRDPSTGVMPSGLLPPHRESQATAGSDPNGVFPSAEQTSKEAAAMLESWSRTAVRGTDSGGVSEPEERAEEAGQKPLEGTEGDDALEELLRQMEKRLEKERPSKSRAGCETVRAGLQKPFFSGGLVQEETSVLTFGKGDSSPGTSSMSLSSVPSEVGCPERRDYLSVPTLGKGHSSPGTSSISLSSVPSEVGSPEPRDYLSELDVGTPEPSYDGTQEKLAASFSEGPIQEGSGWGGVQAVLSGANPSTKPSTEVVEASEEVLSSFEKERADGQEEEIPANGEAEATEEGLRNSSHGASASLSAESGDGGFGPSESPREKQLEKSEPAVLSPCEEDITSGSEDVREVAVPKPKPQACVPSPLEAQMVKPGGDTQMAELLGAVIVEKAPPPVVYQGDEDFPFSTSSEGSRELSFDLTLASSKTREESEQRVALNSNQGGEGKSVGEDESGLLSAPSASPQIMAETFDEPLRQEPASACTGVEVVHADSEGSLKGLKSAGMEEYAEKGSPPLEANRKTLNSGRERKGSDGEVDYVTASITEGKGKGGAGGSKRDGEGTITSTEEIQGGSESEAADTVILERKAGLGSGAEEQKEQVEEKMVLGSASGVQPSTTKEAEVPESEAGGDGDKNGYKTMIEDVAGERAGEGRASPSNQGREADKTSPSPDSFADKDEEERGQTQAAISQEEAAIKEKSAALMMPGSAQVETVRVEEEVEALRKKVVNVGGSDSEVEIPFQHEYGASNLPDEAVGSKQEEKAEEERNGKESQLVAEEESSEKVAPCEKTVGQQSASTGWGKANALEQEAEHESTATEEGITAKGVRAAARAAEAGESQKEMGVKEGSIKEDEQEELEEAAPEVFKGIESMGTERGRGEPVPSSSGEPLSANGVPKEGARLVAEAALFAEAGVEVHDEKAPTSRDEPATGEATGWSDPAVEVASAPTVSGNAQQAAAVPLAAHVADDWGSARGRSDGDGPAKLTRSGQISSRFRTQTDPENVSAAKEQRDKIEQVCECKFWCPFESGCVDWSSFPHFGGS